MPTPLTREKWRKSTSNDSFFTFKSFYLSKYDLHWVMNNIFFLLVQRWWEWQVRLALQISMCLLDIFLLIRSSIHPMFCGIYVSGPLQLMFIWLKKGYSHVTTTTTFLLVCFSSLAKKDYFYYITMKKSQWERKTDKQKKRKKVSKN